MADANGALNAVKKWGSSVAEGTGHFGLKATVDVAVAPPSNSLR